MPDADDGKMAGMIGGAVLFEKSWFWIIIIRNSDIDLHL